MSRHESRRCRWAPAVVAGWLVFAPAPANAFCRTTTVTPPAAYDPRVRGCWTEGVPLRWSTARAPYGVASGASKRVSLKDAMRSVDGAFRAWNETLCETGPLGIQAYDDGPIASVPEGSYLTPAGADASTLARWAYCTDSNACDPQSHDVIVFDDDSWPYDDTANTLALTTVTFGKDDGRIFEAYTEVDSHEHELTATPPPATDNVFDLQAILTHEAGHFFGLAHSADPHAVMNATYTLGKTSLAPDDVRAICAAYANTPRNAGSCATARDRGRRPMGAPPAAVIAIVVVLLGWGRRSLSCRSTGKP